MGELHPVGRGVILLSHLIVFSLLGQHDSWSQEPPRKTDQSDASAAEGSGAVAKPTALSAVQLYAQSAPAVVTLTIKNEAGKAIGSGSGFFIPETWVKERYSMYEMRKRSSPFAKIGEYQNGYLLTNYHVIKPALEIDLTLDDGASGRVYHVVAESEQTDLALLYASIKSPKPVVTLAISEESPAVGADVYAIGSPLGLANSLSRGIVSGFREIEPGVTWLQTTAPLSSGSSGGPVVSEHGTVVGVATAVRRDGQNLNFAVPVAEIRRFLSQPRYESRSVETGASYLEESSSAWIRLPHGEFSFDTTTKSWALLAPPPPWAASLLDARDKADKGDYSEAIELAARAAETAPRDSMYFVHYLIGSYHYSLAYQSTRSELRREGSFAVVRARSLLRSCPDGVAALHSLQKATEQKPDFSPAWARLADFHTQAGEWPEGLIAADSLVRLVPRCAEAYRKRGSCFSRLERSSKALADFLVGEELDPIDPVLQLCIGNEYSALGRYDHAIDHFERARSLEDDETVRGWCDDAIAECKRKMR
jgi:S1-C subfamily serine protease